MSSTMRSSKIRFLVKACALGSLVVLSNVNAQLRRGGDRNLQYGIAPIESVTCHLRVIDAQFEEFEGSTDTKVHACTLDDDASPLGGYTYSIDLPEDFVNDNEECITNGACFVDIPGAQIFDEEGSVPTIAVPESAELMPVDRSESVPSGRKLTSGTHPVLVVRVKAKNRSCTPSSADLAGSVFGLGNSWIENSMKSQYERCSNNQFTFSNVEGNGVTNGVVDVYIDEDVWGTNIFSLTNKMFQAASAAVGTSLNATPKHVMYVVPYGTEFNGNKGWVAFAHVNGYNSWYNDSWGDYLSAQVHEVGHNLGMHHSNENGKAYNDQSGMMGYSYRQKNGPLMCFNAFKHSKFGWYDTHVVDLNNGVWTGELVAFVDANSATSNQKIIVRAGNTYMQLNGAKSFNAGTQEKADEVVLVQGTLGNVESNVVGSLASAGDIVDLSGNISVELCSINLGSVYSARISVFRRNNQSSGCYTAYIAPTPSPTPSLYNPSIGISRFVLVDTENTRDISWGSKASKMSIRAEPWGPVQSVRIVLTGKKSHTQVENVAPFMLNGDRGWNNISSFGFSKGSYRIECTAYPEKRLEGWASQTAVFEFEIN